MKLSKFKFNLPSELIALHPAKNRDESRLMVVHRDTGEIEHREFKDILDYYGKGDVFIFNNTKVFPARLYGNKEKTPRSTYRNVRRSRPDHAGSPAGSSPVSTA